MSPSYKSYLISDLMFIILKLANESHNDSHVRKLQYSNPVIGRLLLC